MRLGASGLSTAGYLTVATIMGLENVLDHVEDFRTALSANASHVTVSRRYAVGAVTWPAPGVVRVRRRRRTAA